MFKRCLLFLSLLLGLLVPGKMLFAAENSNYCSKEELREDDEAVSDDLLVDGEEDDDDIDLVLVVCHHDGELSTHGIHRMPVVHISRLISILRIRTDEVPGSKIQKKLIPGITLFFASIPRTGLLCSCAPASGTNSNDRLFCQHRSLRL